MQFQKFTLDFHKTSVHCGYIRPEDPKGALVLVHGMGEHSGRYMENVVPMLLKMGLIVVVYDNFGHGKSGGKKGHCPNYEALISLLERVLNKASSLAPDLPLFLYGHSMGGNLVLNYTLRKNTDLKGIIATSPYLRLAFEPPKWKMTVGKAMLNVWPSITLPSGLDPNGISRISEEVEKYTSDPLVHDKVSPMFSFPIMDAGEWAIANASFLETETLLLHGTGDPIIDYRATEEFYQNAKTATLKLFEGGYHELHHDNCRMEVLSYIENWLRQQL